MTPCFALIMAKLKTNIVENVSKRKRVSKKNKKSWRKHTDTKDVEAFLDDKRLEERLGAPFSERHDDELFQIDKEADNTKEVIQNRVKKPLKPVRCFAILENNSAVPDPIAKRNRVRTPEERKHPVVKNIEAKRKEQGILKLKERVAHENRLKARRKKLSRPKIGEFKTDLWEDKNEKNFDDSWLSPTTVFHTLKNTGQLKKKMPEKYLKKPFVTPAVESPHPGMSYNPSYGDHQKLLEEVADKELKIQKEEKHLNRVTTKMFSRVSEIQRENMWMEEMSQGLPKETGEKSKQENEEENEGNEYKAINPPVKNKKKTLKARRKLKEARQEALQQRERKIEKKKISDLYRLKFLNKDIETKNEKLEKLREKRKKIKAIKTDGTKHLSKIKFEPLDLEFNLGKELTGNLRGIRPQGNVLGDRFNSMQKRNIIEPGIRRKTKKAKVKSFERKSHKMGWEPKGY